MINDELFNELLVEYKRLKNKESDSRRLYSSAKNLHDILFSLNKLMGLSDISKEDFISLPKDVVSMLLILSQEGLTKNMQEQASDIKSYEIMESELRKKLLFNITNYIKKHGISQTTIDTKSGKNTILAIVHRPESVETKTLIRIMNNINIVDIS